MGAYVLVFEARVARAGFAHGVADKPFGEWNKFRIVMVGSRVSIWLNDKMVVDHAILENYFDKKKPAADRSPILAKGPIQLQTHGSEIRWRNLFVREIGAEEAAKIQGSDKK